MSTVVIIGAGPGGCASAIALARSGACSRSDIVLIEAKAFPRAKVCGEYLSPAITPLLHELLGTRVLVRSEIRPCSQFVLGRDGQCRTLPCTGWSLSRRTLDTALRDAAAAEGVRIVQPARVAKVEYGTGSVGVRLASGETIEASVVIHADGVGRHDIAGPIPSRRDAVGLKCHFVPEHPIEGVHIRAAHGAYVGFVQVEHRLATCAMVATHDALRRVGGDAALIARETWPGFELFDQPTPWLACPVPRSGYVNPGHVRSFRVGNAAAAVEPIGGEGMGLAMWSGASLGRLLAETELRSDALAEVHARVASAYRRRLLVRRPACAAAGAALLRPRLMSAFWPLLGTPRITLGPWYRMTGKPAPRAASI